jgi:hypothetical protein
VSAWYVPLMLAIAAIWGFLGTNAQAALAKGRLLADNDPLIAAAGRAWTPVSRVDSVIASAERACTPICKMTSRCGDGRRLRAEIEAQIRVDPERWRRYEELRRELRAWNALESSVALAAVASIWAFVASLC